MEPSENKEQAAIFVLKFPHQLKRYKGSCATTIATTGNEKQLQKVVSAFTYLCYSSNKGIKAGWKTHFLWCNHEASFLLIVTKQDIQMALDCVESFSAADVGLGAALILCHELHEHSNQLVDCLVINPSILWQQIFDCIIILWGGLSYGHKRH